MGSVQRLPDLAITDTQNLRHKESKHAYGQPACDRLNPSRPFGHVDEPLTDPEQHPNKQNRHEAASHSEDRVKTQF